MMLTYVVSQMECSPNVHCILAKPQAKSRDELRAEFLHMCEIRFECGRRK